MNERLMRLALRLARRGMGVTSPNPMVGAVISLGDRIISQGYHHRAGEPHAEIEALKDARLRGRSVRGATLYVTLEPCSTHGRTPPCTDAILEAGIRRVMVGTVDPNPSHAGRGLELLAQSGVQVEAAAGKLAADCQDLNRAFNHWVVTGLPWVTLKAAMTLDGKIATENGQSKWITSATARGYAMRLRFAADAILAGVSTVVADDPALALRGQRKTKPRPLRRVVLDPAARVPLSARLLNDEHAAATTVVVGTGAVKTAVRAIAEKVTVWTCRGAGRAQPKALDLTWLMREFGRDGVTAVLVEGGGETAAAFLAQGLANEVAFFYAPKVLGGARSRRAVAGQGAESVEQLIRLERWRWRKLGPDLLLQARVINDSGKAAGS